VLFGLSARPDLRSLRSQRQRQVRLLPHRRPLGTSRRRGRSAQKIEDRVHDILVTVSLALKRWQNGLDLCSGETKRLGVARAMVIDPEVFMLDEPTSDIDPKNTEIIEKNHLNHENCQKIDHNTSDARFHPGLASG
jgi:ABC-type lipopolysaccharide export system ATPase subunit